jgi:hypothetical protein
LERRNFRRVLRLLKFWNTYIGGSVALEGAVIDLHNGIIGSMNSPALEVPCEPPGFGAKKSGKVPRTA